MAKQKEKNEAIAVKEEAGLTVANAALANFSKKFGGALVEVRDSLIKPSRLKITNGTSDAFKSRLADLGEFACTLTGKNYGMEIAIIPISVKESASLLFDVKSPIRGISQSDGYKNGDVVCSTVDMIKNQNGQLCRECPYGEFFGNWDGEAPPQCKQSLDMIVVVDGEDKPMIMNFRKNNHPAGREILNGVAKDPMGVPFGTKYTIHSEDAHGQGFDYKRISKNMVKTRLTEEEIMAIIPIAEKVAEAKLAGQLSRISEDDEETTPQGIQTEGAGNADPFSAA